MKKRNRYVGSIKGELINKSRDDASLFYRNTGTLWVPAHTRGLIYAEDLGKN